MGKNAYNLIEVGEIVYAAKDGEPMTIKAKYTVGFVTSEGFFAWDDVRKKFFLHQGRNEEV